MTSSPALTVRNQWIMIAVFSCLTIVAELCSMLLEPEDWVRERYNAFSIISRLVWWLGHGLWLSMDRRRRGLEMGGWRYAVIFLGPLAIWLYLILEYRARALYLIPLSIGIYAVIAIVILGILQLAVR